MTMKRLLLSLALAAGAAQAAPFTVATWNLGWHLNQQEAKAWMAARKAEASGWSRRSESRGFC